MMQLPTQNAYIRILQWAGRAGIVIKTKEMGTQRGVPALSKAKKPLQAVTRLAGNCPSDPVFILVWLVPSPVRWRAHRTCWIRRGAGGFLHDLFPT
jgi:hypothetical protein